MADPFPVRVVEPDPKWPEQFHSEGRRLATALSPYVLAIEHIGSTAIPGLPAKSTIDVLLGLYRLSDAPRVIARMNRLEYVYIPEYEDVLPERRFLRTPVDRSLPPRVNVHAVEVASPFFERHLRFRDWLRAHADDREAYADLKRKAAERFANDRVGYTEAKTPFIRAIEEKALAAERKESAPAKAAT